MEDSIPPAVRGAFRFQMIDPSLPQQKKDLRALMGKKRAEARVSHPDAAIRFRDVFLKNIQLPRQSIIASYKTHGSEMDTAPLNEALRAMDQTIALPVITAKGAPLSFRIPKTSDVFVTGPLGLEEPPPTAPLAEPDILLVPLLAFDKTGYRLGYGGGYYDRTLNALRQRKSILAIGIAFACQEVDVIPAGPNDAKLDKIVTEFQVLTV